MPDLLFDRKLVAVRRKRSLRSLHRHDFLLREVADRLGDRLLDVARRFPVALELGARGGLLAQTLAGRGAIEHLFQAELFPEGFSSEKEAKTTPSFGGNIKLYSVCSEEEALPFAARSFDLVVSNLILHWVNDLPGTLLQINRCLKPDGFFLASLFGGETLKSLRDALMEAESQCLGGVSPRVSPFLEVRDAGGLLQRAGFALPVADFDRLEVSYDSAFALMRDLRGMGESNALRQKTFSRREVFLRAASLYQERFANEEGRIKAIFDVIYLAGWRPDSGAQQQPLKPSSAGSRLTDLLMRGVKSSSP